MRRLLLVSLVTACNAPAPEMPQPGIYALGETVARDDCEPEVPARAPADAALFVRGEDLSLAVPARKSGFYRLDVIGGTGSYTEMRCGATRSFEARLVPDRADAFVVELDEKWRATLDADRACDSEAIVPASDCTRSVRVAYQLVEACAADCRKLVVGLDGRTHCGC